MAKPDTFQMIRALVKDANTVAARSKQGLTITAAQVKQLRILAAQLEKQLVAADFVSFRATYVPESGAVVVNSLDAVMGDR